MNRASPQMRDLAKRLIAHDARENKSHGITAQASFPVSQKLRAPLAALVGGTGFNALQSRALDLASAEVPWLRAVHVNGDGTLEGLAGLDAQVDPGKIIEGRVALLAQLLELLKAFIGENMTMQLMGEVWPKLELNKSQSGIGVEYEREK